MTSMLAYLPVQRWKRAGERLAPRWRFIGGVADVIMLKASQHMSKMIETSVVRHSKPRPTPPLQEGDATWQCNLTI